MQYPMLISALSETISNNEKHHIYAIKHDYLIILNGEPHEKWTAVYLSVDTRRMEAGQKSELNSWGSSTPKPLDSVRFGDTLAVPQKRAACPKIMRLLSGRK